jgi:hypothetical protein
MRGKKIKLISVSCCKMREDELIVELRSLISNNEIQNKAHVLYYLECGLGWKKIWTLVDDLLSNEKKCIGSLDIFTDGVWAWSRDVIYYFKNYNLRLPPAFLQHMSTRNWRMPEIDFGKLILTDTKTVWPCK